MEIEPYSRQGVKNFTPRLHRDRGIFFIFLFSMLNIHIPQGLSVINLEGLNFIMSCNRSAGSGSSLT